MDSLYNWTIRIIFIGRITDSHSVIIIIQDILIWMLFTIDEQILCIKSEKYYGVLTHFYPFYEKRDTQ